MTGALSMGGNLITSVASPVSDTDAATKTYVDGLANFCPAVRVGDYASNMFTSLAAGAVQIAAGVKRASPFMVLSTITIDEMRTRCSTARSANSTYLIGIYTDDNNYPASGLFRSPLIVGSDTNVKTTSISPAITLNKGLHWIVYSASGVTTQPTLRGVAVGGLINALGYNSAMSTSQQYTAYTITQPYTATLPVIFPAGATLLNNTPAPLLALRRSA